MGASECQCRWRILHRRPSRTPRVPEGWRDVLVIPGANLLRMAFSVMERSSFQYRRFEQDEE
ncbi:head protein [Pseudomonas phage WP1]